MPIIFGCTRCVDLSHEDVKSSSSATIYCLQEKEGGYFVESHCILGLRSVGGVCVEIASV